jgi:hypothetical protein
MRLWNKIRAWAGQDGLVEEMRQHREMIEERLRADGMSAGDARNRAAREFGPMATAIEGSRAEYSFAWLEALWSDARYACRALARDKTFAATAVLTLGGGLGAGVCRVHAVQRVRPAWDRGMGRCGAGDGCGAGGRRGGAGGRGSVEPRGARGSQFSAAVGLVRMPAAERHQDHEQAIPGEP